MDRLVRWREKVDRRLKELLEKVDAPRELKEAMAYYPLAGGKRIRPLFLLAVSSALGGDEDDAATAGCALELVHNYSLVHDDLPCMDDDETRRGLPTCHVKYGEALALLAGDALLTYAFELLADEGSFKTLTPEGRLKLSFILAKKAGASGMVGGQVLDVNGHPDLEKVSLLKTGALFEAAFTMGGVVAGKEELLPKLERWGRKVGLLFQMVDDYLDRDGFYALKGEALKREIEKLYGELKEELPPWEELGALLDIFVKKMY
ncbi:MAG: polyprenyl synthetase family protein [Aquificae bacterium]|nr:polyprenyl synthetase family protein [Aquificota bacterium]